MTPGPPNAASANHDEPTTVDLIVVGAGLAGAAVAWAAHQRAMTVRLIDPGDTETSSRVAAGLLTPITGARLTLDSNLSGLWDIAIAHYRAVEALTERRFLTDRVAIRWLRDADEADRWARRSAQPSVTAWTMDVPKAATTSGIAAPYGVFAMRSAQLDTQAYLDATWTHLGGVRRRLDWTRDVTFTATGVQVSTLTARAIVSCEGVLPEHHPAAAGLTFRPARGDVLALRFAIPLPDLVLHRGVWLAPAPTPGLTLAGATYDFDHLTAGPCPKGRADLESRVHSLLPRSYEVVGHRAAVRPILVGRSPVARWGETNRRLGVLTGLGSKGALWAPELAQKLVAAL